MLNVKIGNEYINNIVGMEIMRNHGLSNIINKGDITIYEGYFNGNYFKVEENLEYDFNDYELLKYRENYNDVIIDECLENLIDFITNKEVLRAYKGTNIICKYGRI